MNNITVKVEPTEKPGQWIVVEHFAYMGINVDIGQLTDGASIPWILRPLLKVGGKLFAPSVLHDTGYRLGLFTKPVIDNIYRSAMIENNVPGWKVWVIYNGVKLFGNSSYKGIKF